MSDSFEIEIQKDIDKENFDEHNASKEALHAFKVFLESIETLIKLNFKKEVISYDLGTNKLAIKASEENIELLNKWIDDYKEKRLPTDHKAYKSLQKIEKVFTDNGLTYSAVVYKKNTPLDVTKVFKKEKNVSPPVDNADLNLPIGFHFITGKIINSDTNRAPFSITLEVSHDVTRKIYLTAEHFKKINVLIDGSSVIHLTCHTHDMNKGKVQNWFFEHYSDSEYVTFRTFYDNINSFEGTEKLKYIYRFFNQYVINGQYSRLVKFVNPFLIDKIEMNSAGVQRMILEVVKKVANDEKVTDTFNDLIKSINEKAGSRIY